MPKYRRIKLEGGFYFSTAVPYKRLLILTAEPIVKDGDHDIEWIGREEDRLAMSDYE